MYERETASRTITALAEKLDKVSFMEGIDDGWKLEQEQGFTDGFEQSAIECFPRSYYKGAAAALYILSQGSEKYKNILQTSETEHEEFSFSLKGLSYEQTAEELNIETVYSELSQSLELPAPTELKWRL